MVICVVFAKSITTEHLTFNLGSTDKRFIEMFKKKVVEMNERSFKYARVFDKHKFEKLKNKEYEVLYMVDAIDEFVVGHLKDFEEKKLGLCY